MIQITAFPACSTVPIPKTFGPVRFHSEQRATFFVKSLWEEKALAAFIRTYKACSSFWKHGSVKVFGNAQLLMVFSSPRKNPTTTLCSHSIPKPAWRLKNHSSSDKPQTPVPAPPDLLRRPAPIPPAVDVESICCVGPSSDVAGTCTWLGAANTDQLPRGGLRDREAAATRDSEEPVQTTSSCVCITSSEASSVTSFKSMRFNACTTVPMCSQLPWPLANLLLVS